MTGAVHIVRAPARYTLADLAALARPHLARAGVERAVAFGSYARGDADGYSDLDLVVVMETPLPPTGRGRALLPLVTALPVSVDLLVYTPEEFRRLSRAGRGIFARLAEEGRSIYERADDAGR